MAEARSVGPDAGRPAERVLAEHLGDIALRERLVVVLSPADLAVREVNEVFCRLAGLSGAEVFAAGAGALLSTTTDRDLAAEVAVAASG